MSRLSFTSLYHVSRLARVLAGLAAACALPACSTQLGPIFGGDADGPTGSITPREKRLSTSMNDADWGQAKAALQSALETPTAGQVASWSNPDSGLRGTVTAVGDSFVKQDQTCNAFVATLVDGAQTQWYQGQACHVGSEPWAIAEVSSWRPPKAN